MNIFAYILSVLILVGCAATVVKYDWCLGFCGHATIDKEEAPQHVSEAVKETVIDLKQ